MTVLERFLNYVRFDTQSDEHSTTVPSTEKQKRFGAYLVSELSQIGLRDAHMDEYGYLYGWLSASHGCEGIPAIGLIAHMDTSPSVSGANVNPRVVSYQGEDILLGSGQYLSARQFESLSAYVGQELVITDGTTLLGADDKAGIAEIFSALKHLISHPKINHGPIAVAITPDEEIGNGADHFDIEKFGAAAAYTVDGGKLGELEYENFNAASAKITVYGVNIHPGSAKNKMKNASLIAMEYAAMLPPAETPAHTEGYEGFFHLCGMSGDETAAYLSYLIRDHNKAKFESRRAAILRITAFLNEKYGFGTVDAEITDSYYNMKEKVEPHMYLIHRARAAFERAGITTLEQPIRGGTDGARLSYMGLPCPNLSTGGFNFHSIHEYIPVLSLEKMTQVLVQLVSANC
jgi:tripeptide aminopeptidase